MGGISNLVDELERNARKKALARWHERSATREAGLAKIRQSGIGAADLMEQRQSHLRRETAKANLRFQERIVGNTIDFTLIAPGDRAAKAAAPVARLVRLPGNGYAPRPIATGFMVAPGLLMTNHHVFPRKEEAFQSAANFGYLQDERGIHEGSYFQIDAEQFYFADPDLDFALVAVSQDGLKGERLSEVGFCRLIAATGKILTGMPVNIVQHPEGRPRTFAVTNNRLVDILPEGFLHYETDTLLGSSGSPLFNADWELIGIHHAGIPKVVDGQIFTKANLPFNEDSDREDDIDWIANEGARVSAIVRRLSAEIKGKGPQRTILDSLLATTAETLIVTSDVNNPTDIATPGANMANIVFSFSGPVTINVLPPSPPVAVETTVQEQQLTAPTIQAIEIKQSFDPDYANRLGYDKSFLGVPIELPQFDPQRVGELYSIGDYRDFLENNRSVPQIDTSDQEASAPFVLHYHHYSLCFNKNYRMCVWTASNADYSDAMRQDSRKRAELGGEDWTADPRVPATLQLKNADIYGPGKRIDRGHIVRREDNCWGAPGEETAFANADSYHWTNCTPQHEAFNQENPRDNFTKASDLYKGQKGIWGELEAVVQKQLENGGGQATIFAGPVLDTASVKTVTVDNVTINVPTLFWKVILIPASTARHPQLLAYGYVLSQADVIKKFGLELREALAIPPKFDKMQKSLAEISELTGVIFPEAVLAADQFKE